MVSQTATSPELERQRLIQELEQVTDPEIPVLSLRDLGVLRDVQLTEDGNVEAVITPTFSGCPAMKEMEDEVLAILHREGYPQASVRTQLKPAWTSDWISQEGRAKLKAYGIAPPRAGAHAETFASSIGECPRCGAESKQVLSFFGATSCKSMYYCPACQEPFEQFRQV